MKPKLCQLTHANGITTAKDVAHCLVRKKAIVASFVHMETLHAHPFNWVIPVVHRIDDLVYSYCLLWAISEHKPGHRAGFLFLTQIRWQYTLCGEAPGSSMLDNLKKRVNHLKHETYALYLAARHPKTPWYAKLFAAGVVAYAFSPIDLIPDFIPVLGYLDDLILVPLGIVIALKLVPPAVLEDCQKRSQQVFENEQPTSHTAAAVIIGIWVLLAMLCLMWIYDVFTRDQST